MKVKKSIGADAIKILVESYFNAEMKVEFDYRDIRPKGARLVTSGGKAPGPQPLKDCIHNIEKVLDNAIATRGSGTKLKSIEAHDICCYIADAVLAGGIRRAACISMFSYGDDDILNSKIGNWWESNPQRGRANNSVILLRHKITETQFKELWKRIELSNAGEPGFIFSNDKDMLYNPCGEASLKSFSFCNLTSINASDIVDQDDLNARAKAAAFFGTLQAGFTDFHYLRSIWRTTTEKDSLIGVSMTGIASGRVLTMNIKEASLAVGEENKRVAKMIGIKPAARCCTIKPEGTSSLVLGSSSGIHAWYNKFYMRRVGIGKNEALYKYLHKNHPEIIEDDYFKPSTSAQIRVPMKAPEDAVTKDESPFNLLERMKRFQQDWITPGHFKGSNKHNVSITVYIKPTEWDSVGEWMWENRNEYAGISVLPFDNGSYVQAPFTDITEEEYEEGIKHITQVDLLKVREDDDNTDVSGEVACGGGGCTISTL